MNQNSYKYRILLVNMGVIKKISEIFASEKNTITEVTTEKENESKYKISIFPTNNTNLESITFSYNNTKKRISTEIEEKNLIITDNTSSTMIPHEIEYTSDGIISVYEEYSNGTKRLVYSKAI